eukprot:TRINITY_DN3350_c1_g1_i1.p1 TRINITY_DN3350_c1_g1~~TRINITY_DN3350_c1_g1_i1.p1  ORF type:complete len:227 (+),score=64.95 TRINITY_DN3350_c1_g1_i1:62-682(+)
MPSGNEKLYMVAVLRWKDAKKPVLLCSATDVSSFGVFTRGSVRDALTFTARTVSDPQYTEPGSRQQVCKGDQRVYVHSKVNGLACVVCANELYPSQTALTICSNTLTDFVSRFPGQWESAAADHSVNWHELDQRLAKFQKPEEADKVLRIQRDLEQVRTLMAQSLEAVLKRGTGLQQLLDDSEDLTGATKSFYRGAAAQNACCLVM